MKVAIYSPYLDTFGGGEKYMMTIAEILSQDNKVEILLDKHLLSFGADYLKRELSQRFDLNLKKTNFIGGPVGVGSNFFDRTFFLRRYDLFFYLTDGSILYPTAGKNILHIQTPLPGEVNSIRRKIKLSGWDLIIYNSIFTKDNSEKNWPVKSEIIYPPVNVTVIKPLSKKKYILSVGRFFGFLKDKKHEVLIKTFKELFETGKINEWSLHLVGSAGEGDKEYLEELQTLAKGLPVKFYPNLEYGNLVRLYGEASIYWHASGYKEDDPTKMEHFGISTVEAMAGGCVPIVIGKGGQKEIVDHKKSGYLWDTLDAMKQFTLLSLNDDDLRKQMAAQAIERAKQFSKENFKEKILKIIMT